MRRKLFRSALLNLSLAFLALTGACGKSGKLTVFDVKPVNELPPLPPSVKAVNVGAISFRAVPLLTDEESQELFEANLQLAGLLPIRIELTHNGGEPIDLKKIKLRLQSSTGEEWKTLPIKKAVARILSANQVYAYNPNARKTFEKEFSAYELNLKTPLTRAEIRRSGFVFFLSPRKEAVASPRGLVLEVVGFSQPVSIPLDAR